MLAADSTRILSKAQSVSRHHPVPAKDLLSQGPSDAGPSANLLTEPQALLAPGESFRSGPAVSSLGAIPASEEWRPQPRKRNLISPQRDLEDGESGAKELWVSFPEANRITFYSPTYFASWESGITRKFAELSLGMREVREVEIDTINKTATLSLIENRKKVLRKMVEVYRGERSPDLSVTYSPKLIRVLPGKIPRVRLFRYGKTITMWELRVSVPGWMRLRHALVLNKVHLVEALERELLGLMGFE